MRLQTGDPKIGPVPHHISVGGKRACETTGKSGMVRTARHETNRRLASPFCAGMALITAVAAAALVIYSAAEILVLLR
jgi:hypothetical protein